MIKKRNKNKKQKIIKIIGDNKDKYIFSIQDLLIFSKMFRS